MSKREGRERGREGEWVIPELLEEVQGDEGEDGVLGVGDLVVAIVAVA